jgi:hypothetical protein
MRSGGASVGLSGGASLGSVGYDGEASTDSLSFWMPDDFETTFSVVKVSAAAAIGIGTEGKDKMEIKALELVRVTSDKHPPLLVDLLGGSVGVYEESTEMRVDLGAAVDVELGVMVGGPDVGEIIGQASPRWRHPRRGEVPLDKNQALSEERARSVRGALQGAFDADAEAQFETTGLAGPALDLDDGRASASGTGSLRGVSETRDPDNDDAAYRVVRDRLGPPWSAAGARRSAAADALRGSAPGSPRGVSPAPAARCARGCRAGRAVAFPEEI